jgi:hypothetical protein
MLTAIARANPKPCAMNCTLADSTPHVCQVPDEKENHKALVHNDIQCRQRRLIEFR